MRWFDLLQLAVPLVVLLVGYAFGRFNELRHYRSLRKREREMQSIVALNTRYVPDGVRVDNTIVVSGGVVVSSDAFKNFVAGFRNLVGGRFRGYETLLERARREALLRMKQQARDAGSELIIGVRFHTTKVAGTQVASTEVLAFGTALLRQP
jgi:uncharacterized protein YbjQ (UPF0145 family)